MSKGSRPRPFSVTQQEYDARWDAIFQRDIKEEKIDEGKDPVMEDYQKRVQQQFFEDASCTGGTLKK